MKLITAVLQPGTLQPIKSALEHVGVKGLTVVDARGYGAQAGKVEVYRAREVRVDFVPKIRIEVIVADEQATAAIDAIQETARTGSIGDGKIWVTDVVEVVRVRTGETGDAAVS
ncbi:P-II family nitrogen regulator [Pseudoclavibacter sp. CFCC 13796]|uniref:P-II family nitrogen regulator n=1 Tax=Pseudoclavibacter sp. CFCC 13796 TaxID=2615179 RepID=UPI0013013CF2|nr:P-II family nitrogen regulator [Pseudoclavibacter sp. CFCC 13796]KAB1660859.1 P-II family nitrogen regulator [Pseudoclavibacter sp. CFCC 13796]